MKKKISFEMSATVYFMYVGFHKYYSNYKLILPYSIHEFSRINQVLFQLMPFAQALDLISTTDGGLIVMERMM